MLDVHPPHEPIHTWREFLLHIATITIGLLIALGLEGLVEWQHHRHLVHEAERSLRAEIQSNENAAQNLLDEVHKQQKTLDQDMAELDRMIIDPKYKSPDMSIAFRWVSLDDVSWRTAQNTGALTYMSYEGAQQYAGIYALQAELDTEQKQAIRDAVAGIALFANPDPDDPATVKARNQLRKQRIEVLQGQTLLLDSLIKGLTDEYKKFLSAHPAPE